MKTILGIAWVLGMGCAYCSAQTNTCPAPTPAFCLPSLKLRATASTELAQPQSTPPRVNAPLPQPETIRLESTFSDAKFNSRIIRSGEFYLNREETPSFVEGIFTPTPIRLGKKTTFSCTLLTAIKRKNPLCLLNPFVFQVDW